MKRVFMGMAEVAGYFGHLKKGFEASGWRCTFFHYDHRFQYAGGDESGRLAGLVKAIGAKRDATPRSRLLSKVLYVLLHNLLLVPFFVRSLFSHDLFIFTFGDSFFRNHADLPILKLFGKTVVFVFAGSDHRPPYINGVFVAQKKISSQQCIRLARIMKKRVKKVERYADLILGHHLAAHFHEKPFIPANLLGFPMSLPALPGSPGESRPDGAVRILHAPSTPETKGTAEIRKAVAGLRSRGYRIDYEEISNAPHAAVLEALSRCDFIIDQLYSDARMTGMATEAAFLGKPAVVGGYASDDYLRIDPVWVPGTFPPVLFSAPEEVERSIEKLITDREYRLSLGRAARAFVAGYCEPKKVAERYLRLLSGDVPAHWTYEPKEIRYIFGTGLSSERIKDFISSMIRTGGLQSLQLSDKPALERRFADFCN